MIARLLRTPRELHHRFGYLLVIPFAAVTIVSVIVVASIPLSSNRTEFMPEQDEYMERVRLAEERFGRSEPIVVVMDVDQPLRHEHLARIDEVTKRAARLEHTATVLSLTTVEDLLLVDGALLQRRLFNPDAHDHTDLLDRVRETPLYRRLFFPESGHAVFTFLLPSPDVDPLAYAGSVIEALSDLDVRFYGDSVIEYHMVSTTTREFLLLMLLGLAIVLAIEVIITRSLSAGLLLSVVSLVPALWTLALFPVAGARLGLTNLPVPIIVLVLATSYSIHVYRHMTYCDFDVETAVQEISGVVLVAGFTTIVGFLSLTVARSAYLRELGVLIVAGTAFSLACALVLLPQMLRWWTANHASRYVPSDLWLRNLGGVPLRPSITAAIMLLGMAVLAAGIPSIRSRTSFRDAFVASHPVTQAVLYYRELTAADHELTMAVDSGREYGLVGLETFESFRRFGQDLRTAGIAEASVSYVDFVEWLLGRMHGVTHPVRPESDYEIGEALELLSGRMTGLGIDSLVDRSWRHARIVAWVDLAGAPDAGPPGPRPAAPGEAVIGSLERAGSAAFGAAEIDLMGMPVTELRRARYLIRSQLISLLLFGCFLVALVLVIFRSLRIAMLAVLPTVAGVVSYFGLMGWLGMLHDVSHVLLVCMLLGVSNDDVLYYLLVYRRMRCRVGHRDAVRMTHRRTGVPIIQTTLIIVAGVSVFYASAITYLGMAALLVTAGLITSTATTLWVIPALIELGETRDEAR